MLNRYVISRVLSTTGYYRYALAALLGAILSLALPPLYIFPAASVALVFILRMHDALNSRASAFWLGWWFGFGHFTTGFYWISFALLVDVAQFWWLIPFALFGIAGIIALYLGLTFLLLYLIPARGLWKIMLFATLWTLIEMLRGLLFTGFPWNLIGSIWGFSTPMLQLASVWGIWGLSFLTIATLTMPYMLWFSDKHPWRACLGALAVLTSVWGLGAWRIHQNPHQAVPNIHLRIVQGNIPQTLKWDPQKEQQHLNRYIQLSLNPGYENITHLIWPETAIPYPIQNESDSMISLLRPIIPQSGALISGALHIEATPAGEINRLWNAALVLPHTGNIQFYHKSHLVPFGEYIPFRNLLGDAIQKMTDGRVDFSAGEGNKTLSVPGFVPFSPLICYEAIFPNEVRDPTTAPQVLINVTNDAWYGISSGPFQHFESTRMRAIEQGVPLIRAANTGISGVIDPYGRIMVQSKLETTGVLDAELPKALTSPTLYSKMGRAGIALPLILFLVFSLFKNRNRHVSIRKI